MRVLNQADIASVSGGAAPNPLITVPYAVINGLFTVVNVLFSFPALLAYRS
jgi:hypothetical protein